MKDVTLLLDILNTVSADVKIKLYDSYCCSIYCCALLSVYHKTVLDKLSVACNKVFKRLMRVPRDFGASVIFVSLNVCNFFHSQAQAGLQCFVSNSVIFNSLTCTLYNSVHFSKCKLKEEWDKLKYYKNKLIITTMTSLYIVLYTNSIL